MSQQVPTASVLRSAGPGSNQFPVIGAVQWLPAKTVLGGEASDFTPWLAQPDILEILGSSLRLEALTALAQEHPVLGKRLDILASAEDESGEEVVVCIENQYGMSDADHLGRLIAYLAQHERGRAVWIVELAHDAFVAAVRFLNRTSGEDVGYYLVQVRFTHGEANGFQVHFEVLAAPIAWEKPTTASGHKTRNSRKVTWMNALKDAAAPALLGAGFQSMNVHAHGNYMWVRWPEAAWLRKYGKNLTLRARQDTALVTVGVNRYATRELNTAAIEVLQQTYGSALNERLPDGSEIRWKAAQSGVGEQVRVVRAGDGYANGDPAVVAAWAADVANTWLALVLEQPVHDLDDQVAALTGSEPHALDDDEAAGDGEE